MRFWIEPDGDPSDPDAVGELFELVRPGEDLDNHQARIRDLKYALDREVEAHRLNCEALAQMTSRAIAAEDKLVLISHSFMELHNIAKDVVGPKVDKTEDVSTPVPFKWTQGCPGGRECICPGSAMGSTAMGSSPMYDALRNDG